MTIEISAKKVDDAIKEGLAQLGATLDQVTVEVLESGGLFRKAKVRLTLDAPEEKPEVKEQAPETKKPEAKKPEAKKEQAHSDEKKSEVKKEQKAHEAKKASEPKKEQAPEAKKTEPKKEQKASEAKKPEAKKAPEVKKAKEVKKPEPKKEEVKPAEKAPKPHNRKRTEEELETLKGALEFVKATVQKMGFEVTVEADENNPEYINITAPDGDDSLIIGRHGETLSALSYLAETCARAEKMRISVTVDCNGYRGRRAASLSAMARRRANECAYKHRKIKLEPMERIDRRTIHTALGDDDRVTTRSEGKEPYRYVVILPVDNRKPKAEESED